MLGQTLRICSRYGRHEGGQLGAVLLDDGGPSGLEGVRWGLGEVGESFY